MARIIPIDTAPFQQRQIIPRPQQPAGQELRETAQNAQSIGAIIKALSLASDFFGPAVTGASKGVDALRSAPKQRAALDQAAQARAKAQRQKGVAPRRGTEEEIQEVATIRETRGIAPDFAGELGQPGPLAGDELLSIDVIMRDTGATREDATAQVKAKKLADFQSQQAVTARRRQLLQAPERGELFAGLSEQEISYVRGVSPEKQGAAVRAIRMSKQGKGTAQAPPAEEGAPPGVGKFPQTQQRQPSAIGRQMPSYAERLKPRALTEGQLQQAGAAAVEREGVYDFNELNRRAALATDQKELDQVMQLFERSGGIGVHPETVGEIFSGAHMDRARKELAKHTKRFVPQSALESERLRTAQQRTKWRKETTKSAEQLTKIRKQRAKDLTDQAQHKIDILKARLDTLKSKRSSAKNKAEIDKQSQQIRIDLEQAKLDFKRAQVRAAGGRTAASYASAARSRAAKGAQTALTSVRNSKVALSQKQKDDVARTKRLLLEQNADQKRLDDLESTKVGQGKVNIDDIDEKKQPSERQKRGATEANITKVRARIAKRVTELDELAKRLKKIPKAKKAKKSMGTSSAKPNPWTTKKTPTKASTETPKKGKVYLPGDKP